MEATLLAAHVLGVERSRLLILGASDFPNLAGEALIQRRLTGEPLSYILGYREFFGHRFVVTNDVLIPRHETEVIVEMAIRVLRPGQSVLDIGTGSGCIGLSIARHIAGSKVTLSDSSPEALAVAQLNAGELPVNVVLGDLFQAVEDQLFDLIISNPPYIGLGEALPSEVVNFEPHLALFADNTGLFFYERLAKEGQQHLCARGSLIVEVGFAQADPVTKIFEGNSWRLVEVAKDLLSHDRGLRFEPQ